MRDLTGLAVQQHHFSPWRDDGRKCATCRHSIGSEISPSHLWCQRSRIVVVFPCGEWEREPGADD